MSEANRLRQIGETANNEKKLLLRSQLESAASIVLLEQGYDLEAIARKGERRVPVHIWTSKDRRECSIMSGVANDLQFEGFKFKLQYYGLQLGRDTCGVEMKW